MKTSLFDFDLPESLIATEPASPRDSAKLLVAGNELEDRIIHDLPTLLKPGDILVFNDSRVIPARLFGKIGGHSIEVLLYKPVDEHRWEVLAKPARKVKDGSLITFGEDFYAKAYRLPDGEVELAFNLEGKAFDTALAHYGHVPLPPYIRRPANKNDNVNYQTVYAKEGISVAAPTAGLHFTDDLLQKLSARGIRHAFVRLDVGLGTFQPVKVEDTSQHAMHKEYGCITSETAAQINRARKNGGRIIAVGTTSLRLLETAADESGTVHPWSGETSIFITPGYRFKTADMLLTNFHLPRSTLFMLVCAFAGIDLMKQAYAHAIHSNYRFYSYGDAMLIYRHP